MATELLTPMTFTEMVDEFIHHHDVSYLDAIQHLCDRHGIETDVIPSLMTPRLQQLVQDEALRLHLLNRKLVPNAPTPLDFDAAL